MAADRHTRPVTVRLLLLAMALGAGSGCVFSPSDLTEAQVAGTWTLESMQPAGQALQLAPASATYALTLANGSLSTRADCNTCTGRYTLARKVLTAGPALACTRAACPTMAFENTYTGILSGESSVILSPAALMFTSSRGTLRYTR